MLYVVGYGKYQIVREDQDKPFFIYPVNIKNYNPSNSVAGPFYSFTDARRECDYLRRG